MQKRVTRKKTQHEASSQKQKTTKFYACLMGGITLGEAATREIAVNRNAQGFVANAAAAKVGGKIAGDARRELEEESGKPVISKENYHDNLIAVSLEPESGEAEEKQE